MWVAQNCIQWKVYFSPIPDHPPPSQGQFLVTQGQFSCSRSNSVPVKRAAPVRVYAVMFDPLRLCGLQPARLLCPWDSPGKNTGAGCHSFLQGIFPAQGSNPGSALQWIPYQLSHQGSSLFLKSKIEETNYRLSQNILCSHLRQRVWYPGASVLRNWDDHRCMPFILDVLNGMFCLYCPFMVSVLLFWCFSTIRKFLKSCDFISNYFFPLKR